MPATVACLQLQEFPMLDIVFVVGIIALVAVVALIAKGVERL